MSARSVSPPDLPAISARQRRFLEASRRSRSEPELNFGSLAVATRAALVKLPRIDSDGSPVPNSYFQSKGLSTSVVIGKAPEPPKRSFDPKFVLMLRDFFLQTVADGSVHAQRSAFEHAITQPQFKPMGDIEFPDVLAPSGQMSFNKLLTRYYPSATSGDIREMIRAAFPRRRRSNKDRAVTREERTELTKLFHMFDEDRSNSISLKEFLAATKGLNMVRDDQLFWMFASDSNGDGELSLEEWISAMHNAYF